MRSQANDIKQLPITNKPPAFAKIRAQHSKLEEGKKEGERGESKHPSHPLAQRSVLLIA